MGSPRGTPFRNLPMRYGSTETCACVPYPPAPDHAGAPGPRNDQRLALLWRGRTGNIDRNRIRLYRRLGLGTRALKRVLAAVELRCELARHLLSFLRDALPGIGGRMIFEHAAGPRDDPGRAPLYGRRCTRGDGH